MRTSAFRRLLPWLVTALLAIALPCRAAPELEASLDRTVLASGETLELTLTYPGRASGDPDLAPLAADFDILDRSHQNRISMVNGSVSATTTWRITLAPKRTGDLQIPPLALGDARSHALDIRVTADAAEPATADRPVFAEANLDRDDAMPGEQVLLTVALYTRIELSDLSMAPLAVPGAELIQSAENRYRKEIRGVSYQVIELRYALIANQEGELDIPSARFGARAVDSGDPFDRVFGGGRPLHIGSPPLRLHVGPRPAGAGTDWLPVRALRVEQKWSTAKRQVPLGEPITRTLTLTATGTSAARIPPLELPAPEGYRRYPDQPELHDATGAAGLTGRRTESFAVVAERPGPLELPPLRVRWWNTSTRKFEEILVPGEHFDILPAAGTAAPPPTASAASEPAASASAPATAAPAGWNMPLVYGLIAANLMLLTSTLAFAALWRRQKSPARAAHERQRPRADFAPVARAAATGDGVRLRAAILAWAREHWQDAGILSLRQVADRAGRETLRAAFRRLDASCYAPGGGPVLDLDALVAELRSIARAGAGGNRKAEPGLPPLYPH